MPSTTTPARSSRRTPRDSTAAPRTRKTDATSLRASGALKSNGFGTVRPLPSGRFQAFFTSEGHRVTAPGTFATADDARAWLDDQASDRRRGRWHDTRRAENVTLEAFARGWVASRPDLSPKTLELYELSLRRWILPAIPTPDGGSIELGTVRLADLSVQLLTRWHAAVLVAARQSSVAKYTPSARAPHPVRAWAKAQGIDLAATGRISPDVVRAWEAAGSPRVAPAPVPAPQVMQAGRTATSRAFGLLRAILNTAVRQDILPRNPALSVEGTGKPKRRRRGVATVAEVRALASHFPEHLQTAVLLAAWSGLRHAELFGLARRHVNLDAGTVTVERALLRVSGQPVDFGTPKSEGSYRTVHLPGFVVDAVRDHLEHHTAPGPDALIFTTTRGGAVSPSCTSRLMHRARKAIGREDLTWHDLRHTGATLAYAAGGSVPDVQQRLDHSTDAAARIYQHTYAGRDQALAARLSELYDPLAS